MTVLLVLITIGAIASVVLCIEMSRRNEALLGFVALVLMVASVLGSVYAALAAGS